MPVAAAALVVLLLCVFSTSPASAVNARTHSANGTHTVKGELNAHINAVLSLPVRVGAFVSGGGGGD